MADQPIAPDEPFDQAGAVGTSLAGDNVKTAMTVITAPETPTGGGGGGSPEPSYAYVS